MIYTDGKHLISTDINELHEFARQIGLKREWFQDHRHPHYDIMGRKFNHAITSGAVLVTTRILIKILTGGNPKGAMMAKSRSRGHQIEHDESGWIYSDNKEPAFTERPCHWCCKKPVQLILFDSLSDSWQTKNIDFCIADIVRALQVGGIKMVSSCCGHHRKWGWIQLANGKLLKIQKVSEIR